MYYFGENIIIAQIMLFKIIIIKYHKSTYTHVILKIVKQIKCPLLVKYRARVESGQMGLGL